MKIRNPKSYDKKRSKIEAERARRLDAAVSVIQDLTGRNTFYAKDLSDMAWLLRRAGSLGQNDRRKLRHDPFTKFSEEALHAAIAKDLVVVNACKTGLRISRNGRATVPRRTYRKFERVEYPATILDMSSVDIVDQICDPASGRFTHLKGSSSLRELTSHT